MRRKERINIFLNKMDLHKVLALWFPDLDEDVRVGMAQRIYPKLGKVEEEWYKYPDLRFSQVLINMGLMENYVGTWYYMEESTILDKIGIPKREYMLWGKNYDKDRKPLSKTVYVPIEKMDTDHIEKILHEVEDLEMYDIPSEYITIFKEELKFRKQEENTSSEDIITEEEIIAKAEIHAISMDETIHNIEVKRFISGAKWAIGRLLDL